MATTSMEGSRRANYPIPTRGGSDNKYQCRSFMSCNWNEYNLNPLTSNNWRASLVPAAAVIPAPIAYINVAAVKKLVVGSWNWVDSVCQQVVLVGPFSPTGVPPVLFTECGFGAFLRRPMGPQGFIAGDPVRLL